MIFFRYLTVFALVAVTFAQDDDYYEPQPRPRPAPARIQPGYSGPTGGQSAPRPTPVPILKQINRHNEDGSYTYGYESADGTFKIETKLPTGEVKGKYGYVDDTGKVRVVEYGATKYGFDPSGEGITVPPPTLVDETRQEEEAYEDARAAPVSNNYPAARPRPQPKPQQRANDFQSYSPPQQFDSAPAPPRPRISGAAPAPLQTETFDFGPPSRPAAPARSFAPAPRPKPAPVQFAQPTPIQDEFEPAPRPAQRISYADPAPLSQRALPSFGPSAPSRPVQQFAAAPRAAAPRPAPSYAPRPNPSIPTAGRNGGILDQLSKDYALPDGGASALHDISFGYY